MTLSQVDLKYQPTTHGNEDDGASSRDSVNNVHHGEQNTFFCLVIVQACRNSHSPMMRAGCGFVLQDDCQPHGTDKSVVLFELCLK